MKPRHHIGGESLISQGIRDGRDNSFTHARVACQHRRDLGKFHAEAANLYLPVSPTQQLQNSSICPTRTVASRVHSRSAPSVRVRHKPLGRLT